VVMRLHFTHEDLLRTTIAEQPAASQEMVDSAKLLRRAGERAYRLAARGLVDWSSRACARLTPPMRPFLDLIPATGTYVPDFLTPPDAGDLESTVDSVLHTPRRQLRAELERLLDAGLAPARVSPLRDGNSAALRQLGDAMRRYHADLVAPGWAGLTTVVDADRGYRAQQLATGGMERMLHTLCPDLAWDTATLTYACSPQVTIDIRLDGRGLALQPSLFAVEPAVLVPERGPVLLNYPARREHLAPPPGENLCTLLGRTRAAVLAAVPPSATTTQLAGRVGVSLASASQHAMVLRRAGLIATVRTGPAVQHTLTPLGSELLGTTRTPG
jgi:DNA-binding transcriptional ArsR family regulator